MLHNPMLVILIVRVTWLLSYPEDQMNFRVLIIGGYLRLILHNSHVVAVIRLILYPAKPHVWMFN